MKRYFIGMIVLLIIGAVICGGGAMMYSQSDNRIFEKDLEYTEKEYVAQSQINAIDFSLSGNYNFILQKGDNCSISYSESEISQITVSETDGILKLREKIKWTKIISSWYHKQPKTDLILTLPEYVVLSMRCHFSGMVTLDLPEWEFGNIDMKISGAATIASNTFIKANDVNFDVSGTCSANIKGELDNLDVKVSGASEMAFDGSAQSINMKSSGATTF
ncbi:MAG: DUF2807 domain-containing protein, partial [Clostridia bacterium]|nr:DUF2807 domain-containing protein [Clostridia bacterium]